MSWLRNAKESEEDFFQQIHDYTEDDIKAIEKKLKKKKIAPDAKNDDGETAFVVAAGLGRMRIMELFLEFIKKSKSVSLSGQTVFESRNKQGATPIMAAAASGMHAMVQLLADNGCKIDAADEQGRTAVMLAAEAGKTDTVALLVDDLHADIFAKTVEGQTAYDMAHGWDGRESRAILKQAMEGKGHTFDVPVPASTTTRRSPSPRVRRSPSPRAPVHRSHSPHHHRSYSPHHHRSYSPHRHTEPVEQPQPIQPKATHTAPVPVQNDLETMGVEIVSDQPDKTKALEREEGPIEFLDAAARTQDYHAKFVSLDLDWEDVMDFDTNQLVDRMGVAATHAKRIMRAIEDRRSTQPAVSGGVTRVGDHDLSYLTGDFEIAIAGHKQGGEHMIVMATRKATGEDVALKIHSDKADFENERSKLVQLRGDEVVKLIDVKEYSAVNRFVLVEERCRETLDDIIQHFPGGLPREDAQALAIKVHKCVDHLKKKGIVHCDIKPKNFGVVGNSLATQRLVLLDVDGACVQYQEDCPEKVTLAYCAPERLQGKIKAENAVDLWSVGVMFYQMFTGKLLGMGMSEAEIKEMLTNEEFRKDWPASIGLPLGVIQPDSARRLVERLLQWSPGKRSFEGSFVTGHTDTTTSSLVRDVKAIRKGVSHIQAKD